MGLFAEDLINQVRDRADIVQIISDRIPLKRAGSNLKGLCPFHAEKTPSFMVSPDKQIYHCFGCGSGGNVFSFLMKADGLSFPEAIRKMAGKYGIPLPEVQAPTGDQAASRLYFKLNAFAARFYQAELQKMAATTSAQHYIKKRRLTAESLASFGLGWAEPSGDRLVQALKQAKAPLDKAMEVGLIRIDESGHSTDFFRGRLMFPISDPRGRIVGFGGRTLVEGHQGPKYLNSPDTKIFHKGNLLYGLWQAKKEIQTTREVMLVEGYLDVISLHQGGFKNAVAPLGTALTDAHIQAVNRLAERWLTFFDGDEAGARATHRALDLFLKHSILSRTIPTPTDEDPDSLLGQDNGAELIQTLRSRAPLTFVWVLQQELAATEGKLEGRLAAIQEAAARMQQVTDPLVARLLVREIAETTGIEEQLLARPSPGKTSKEATLQTTAPTLTGSARRLMELVAAKPQLWNQVDAVLGRLSIGDPVLEELMAECSRCYRQWGHLDFSRILDDIQGGALSQLLTELVVSPLEVPATGAEQALAEILDRMIAQGKKRAMVNLTVQIRAAEERKDDAIVAQLVAKKQQMMTELNLGAR